MKVTIPIALRGGAIATVEFSQGCEGNRLVRISIPKRASIVNILDDENPVTWIPIDLDELWLPEEYFSQELLRKVGASAS